MDLHINKFFGAAAIGAATTWAGGARADGYANPAFVPRENWGVAEQAMLAKKLQLYGPCKDMPEEEEHAIAGPLGNYTCKELRDNIIGVCEHPTHGPIMVQLCPATCKVKNCLCQQAVAGANNTVASNTPNSDDDDAAGSRKYCTLL